MAQIAGTCELGWARLGRKSKHGIHQSRTEIELFITPPITTSRTMTDAQNQQISLELIEGWHCSHLYYRFDRSKLADKTSSQIAAGRDELIAVLDPAGPNAPARLQTSIVSGHKADFG